MKISKNGTCGKNGEDVARVDYNVFGQLVRKLQIAVANRKLESDIDKTTPEIRGQNEAILREACALVPSNPATHIIVLSAAMRLRVVRSFIRGWNLASEVDDFSITHQFFLVELIRT